MKTRQISTLARTFAIAALIAAVSFTPVALAQEDSVTVPLSDPTKPAFVRVSIVAGSIEVEAWDGDHVLVESSTLEDDEAWKSHAKSHGKNNEGSDRSGLRSIPNTGAVGFSVAENDNKVRIKASSWNQGIRLSIKVPVRTSLKLTTVEDGDIVVRGVEGELELGNTDGNIEAIDVSGTIVAQTVDGDITVSMRSVDPAKPMSFTSLDGDVDVTLPATLAADLKVFAEGGEILTDFDFVDASKTERSIEGGEGEGFRAKITRPVTAQINGGGMEILFKTFEGDVLVRKGS